ncbi:hypothetical protein EDC04DRAFT_2597447 [Pisolithus marmoratus]|nr:hypothetical protein EDC04DRAFT_2597447 [Pisolithus marmoratus]
MGVDCIHHSIKKKSYQPYWYMERDISICNSFTIPIHHQPFPLYQPLLAEHALFIREELDFNAIPIHHQIFPSPDDTTKGTLHPSAIKFHKTGVLGGPSYEREITQHVKGTVESMMKPRVTVPECQEHKIQNLNVIIGRFISLGNIPLEHPPIWLRDGDQWLPDIRDRYHHPMLPEYHLYMAEGMEPTWVTLKITLKNENNSTTVERDKQHAATRDEVTKSVQTKSFPSDVLLITILTFLLVLTPGWLSKYMEKTSNFFVSMLDERCQRDIKNSTVGITDKDVMLTNLLLVQTISDSSSGWFIDDMGVSAQTNVKQQPIAKNQGISSRVAKHSTLVLGGTPQQAQAGEEYRWSEVHDVHKNNNEKKSVINEK